MIKKEGYSKSSKKNRKIHWLQWIPEGEVKATLQISHGMIEHIGRYDEFACFLASQGFFVVGHDHLGHGKTSPQDHLGHFSDQKGSVYVIQDIRRVAVGIKHLYPNVPHFILGHSMGSFFVRKYLTMYGWDTAGAILMGTGNRSYLELIAGSCMVDILSVWRGSAYRSKWMHYMVLGRFNKRFRPVKTPVDWLSRDQKKIQEYIKDPYSHFMFSCKAYRDLFQIMLDLKQKRNLNGMPKKLPIYLLSGSDDPVGGFGKEVSAVYQQMKKMGMSHVSIKLYEGWRHELLNEVGCQSVYEEISEWILIQLKQW